MTIYKKIASSRKFRGAIIGLGHQGNKEYLSNFLKASNCTLRSVCDVDCSTYNHLINSGVNCYSDYVEMIEKENIDFCIVSVPHSAHREIVLELLRKKIPVLKEKPLAINFKEASEISKAVELYKTPVIIPLARRFFSAYKMFKTNLKLIGNPLYIKGEYFLGLEVPHFGWRASKETAGGGCLIDMGYHIIDLLIWFFGMPKEIHTELAYSILPQFKDVENTAQVSFSYECGLHGSILISRSLYPKSELLKVFGTKGCLTVCPSYFLWESKTGKKLKEVYFSSKNEFNQIDNFPIILMNKNEFNFCYVLYHLQHSAFIESCYLSSFYKRSINPQRNFNL
jgi:predicted dehydrogenase